MTGKSLRDLAGWLEAQIKSLERTRGVWEGRLHLLSEAFRNHETESNLHLHTEACVEAQRAYDRAGRRFVG